MVNLHSFIEDGFYDILSFIFSDDLSDELKVELIDLTLGCLKTSLECDK